MNKNMLAKTLNFRMRIQPIAERIDTLGRKLNPIDDVWIVKNVGKEDGLHIVNERTGHGLVVPYDHIHDYRSDLSVRDGFKHGFLMLF